MSITSQALIELEQQALKARNAGNIERAAELFASLVQLRPNWEHGQGCYDLACCYEDLSRFDLADKFYREALQFQPRNDIFVGGYASFLYLHGDLKKAFELSLLLYELEQRQHAQARAEKTMILLRTIGHKLGLSDAEIAAAIEKGVLD